MTVYTDAESSATDGAPIEGYQFVGPQASYRYTNAQADQTINGLLFTKTSIKRSAIKAGTQEDDSLEVELDMPFDLPLVFDYGYATAPPSLTLTIYRYHGDTNPATDWVIIWQGEVSGFLIEEERAKIRVPAVFEQALRGNMPTVFYQAPCNHVLGDALCKVNLTLFKATSTVSSITGSGLTINVVNDGFADGDLVGGILYAPLRGERRLILSNVANVVGINFPFHGLVAGDVVELQQGCDHAYLGHCDTRFANTINFGGAPYVPKENPFEGEIG